MHAHRYDISDIPFARLDPIETGNWGVNTFARPPRIRKRIRRRRRNGLGGNLARFQLGAEWHRENVELSLLKNTSFPDRYFRVEFPADRLWSGYDIVFDRIRRLPRVLNKAWRITSRLNGEKKSNVCTFRWVIRGKNNSKNYYNL